jgi:hypothetical protein
MFGLDVLLAFALAAALALVGARLGGVLLARLGLPASAERTIAATALGIGAISHAGFVVGLFGGLGRWLPFALIAAALPSLRSVIARARGSRVPWLIAFAALPIALVALQPPTAWDAITYHLTQAKAYALSGHVAPVMTVRYQVFPQLEEILFTLGLSIAGPIAPALTELLFAALTAAALWAWGRRWFSPRAGVAAAALWLASPMIIFLATAAYIDIGLTCYATLAVLCAGNAFADDEDGWLWIAGALGGLAASCKYLGLPFVAGIGLCALARRRWRGAVGFAALAALTGLPWYVYNFVHTGNPVFPFASELFGFHGPWNARDLAAQLAEMHTHGVGRSLPALALLPWSLTAAQSRFQVEAPFLPLFLPALALAAFGALRDAKVRALLTVAIAYGLFWFATVQILRYLTPASAIFSLAVAAAAQPLVERIGPKLRVVALLALLAPPIAYASVRVVGDGLPVTADGRRAFLSRAVPGFDVVDKLNREHGSSWSAYQLQLERLHFFADGLLLGDWFGPTRYAPIYPLLGDAAALADHLRQFHVEYFIDATDQQQPNDARFPLVDATPSANLYRIR